MVFPRQKKSRARAHPKLVKGERILSVSFPSEPQGVDPMVARVLQALSKKACTDGKRAEIELALREAIANAVIHGNGGNHRKRVRVECFRQTDDSLLLVVRDSGEGFDPSTVDDPTKPENLFRSRGRGIFLIRHFMDDVEFACGGREVRMRKRLAN